MKRYFVMYGEQGAPEPQASVELDSEAEALALVEGLPAGLLVVVADLHTAQVLSGVTKGADRGYYN